MSWRTKEGGSVVGSIAAAFGKGFWLACAAFTVAAIFGTPSAAGGLWTILATAAVGSCCLLAAAVIRREQCEADRAAQKEVRELMTLVRKLPGVQQPNLDLAGEEQTEQFTSR